MIFNCNIQSCSYTEHGLENNHVGISFSLMNGTSMSG